MVRKGYLDRNESDIGGNVRSQRVLLYKIVEMGKLIPPGGIVDVQIDVEWFDVVGEERPGEKIQSAMFLALFDLSSFIPSTSSALLLQYSERITLPSGYRYHSIHSASGSISKSINKKGILMVENRNGHGKYMLAMEESSQGGVVRST